VFSSAELNAQSTVSDGVKSFKNGDFNAAIQQLKNSDDPIERSFLGQSYEAVSKKKEAGKAYERSLKSGYALVEIGLKDWGGSKVDPSFLSFLRSLSETLTVSISSAENAVRLGAMSSDNEWRLKANTLHYLKRLETDGEEIFRSSEVDASVKLLVKPRARLENTACYPNPNKGTAVLLQVVFNADGRTITAIPYSTWIKGCSVSAMEAAKLIKFEPAVKNGKPVTTFRILEYSFGQR